MRSIISILFLLAALSYGSRKDIVDSCDIVRNDYQADSCYLPLLQGNGRFGAMAASFGLQTRPSEKNKYSVRMGLYHLGRSMRAGYGADYLAPVAVLYWNERFEDVSDYIQKQFFHEGTVSTSFAHKDGRVRVLSWFDPVDRNVAFYKIESSSSRKIIIENFAEMTTHYSQRLTQTVTITETGKGHWCISLDSPQGSFRYFVSSGFEGTIEDGKLILCTEGSSFVKISCCEDNGISLAKSLRQTVKWWRSEWEKCGFIKFSSEDEQKVFVREMAHILSSFNDDGTALAPPMGLSGNGWPFAFPQDISYIHPALLSTGHIREAAAIVEYFANQIPELEEYTSRLVGAEGIFCPWTMPYAGMNGFHNPSTPNIFFYETHNSGYLCRMAYETSLFVNDEKWTKQYAYPIIKGCAEFYRSIAKKGKDGFWHIFMNPGMGQDEAGGICQMDYLCSLFSARYCFEKAVECGLDTDGSYQSILNDSLAFETLKSETGYYFSCKGSGPEDYGRQKHPVQLNPFAYLPMNGGVGNEDIYAYKHRYDITKNANDPFFHGWTLGEFLLASSRAADRSGWMKDWNNIQKSDYADRDWTQFYETSKAISSSYYITTSGLVLQSLISNLVSDWTGELIIAGCVPPSWKGPVEISSLFSKLGVSVSGTIYGQGDYRVRLKAWKDCKFVVDGTEISLKKGESIIL